MPLFEHALLYSVEPRLPLLTSIVLVFHILLVAHSSAYPADGKPSWPQIGDSGDNYDGASISVVVKEGGRFGEYGRLEVSENFIAHSERSPSAAYEC